MQPSMTAPTVPAVQLPVMLVAEVQDSLLVVVHDLTRLDGLLAHTMENLMERLVVLVNEPCIEIGHLPENMQAKKETSGVDRDAVMLNRIIPYKQAVEELDLLLGAGLDHRARREEETADSDRCGQGLETHLVHRIDTHEGEPGRTARKRPRL